MKAQSVPIWVDVQTRFNTIGSTATNIVAFRTKQKYVDQVNSICIKQTHEPVHYIQSTFGLRHRMLLCNCQAAPHLSKQNHVRTSGRPPTDGAVAGVKAFGVMVALRCVSWWPLIALLLGYVVKTHSATAQHSCQGAKQLPDRTTARRTTAAECTSRVI